MRVVYLFTLLSLYSGFAQADWRKIADGVEAKLLAERQAGKLGPYEMEIDVYRDHVTLIGSVASETDRESAERLARATEGVGSVSNKLEVSQMLTVPEAPRASVKLAVAPTNRAVLDALARNGLNTQGLDVAVTDGKVILAGSRESQRDIDAVLAVVLMLDGVTDIESNLTIGGQPYRTGLKAEQHG